MSAVNQPSYGEISTRALANSVGDGGAYDRFSVVNTRQHCAYLVERGLLTVREMEDLMAQLGNPSFLELRTITVYTWGRRS